MTEPTTALATRTAEPELTPFEVMERVITSGDLGKMAAPERVAFYWRTCESLGLNPLTRPFEYLNLNGKITLYARKDATDQLRAIRSISVVKLERDRVDDLAMITAYGRDRSGREDSAVGAVSIAGLRGEALANAWMKAETKAKRRMTLSLAGLGFLDESETAAGTPVDVDPSTGVIAEQPKPPTLLAAVQAQAERLDEPAAAAPEPESVPTRGPSSGGPADPEQAPAGATDAEEAQVTEVEDDPVADAAAAEADFRARAIAAGITKGRVRKAAIERWPGRDELALTDAREWELTAAEWGQLAQDLGL